MLLGPSKYFIRKKFMVEMMREESKKCTKIKTRVIFRIEGNEGAYARPQARDVRSWKADRR